MSAGANARRELAKLLASVSKIADATKEESLLPSAIGIPRVEFQRRAIARMMLADPVGLAPIIEATRKSMEHALKSRS